MSAFGYMHQLVGLFDLQIGNQIYDLHELQDRFFHILEAVCKTMGNDSTIIHFIRNNFKLLQKKEFPELLYKKIKQEHFAKHKAGKPKDTEISKVALSHYIRKNVIKNEDKLGEFLELPFFKKNIFDVDIFYEELSLKNQSSDTVIDPSKIKDAEYVTQKKEEMKVDMLSEYKQVFDEQISKLQSEFDQKQKDLDRIPTRLDDTEVVEPQTHESGKEHREWWQVLNLSKDPIPTQEGFQRIDTDYYDDIVVKTDIFVRYVGYSNKMQDQIFKNTVFYGEFGSGKTSFFDYLKQILSKNKILLVSVSIWPSPDSDKIILDFHSELIESLRNTSEKFGTNLSHIKSETPAQTIKQLLKELHRLHNFKGFVVVVDDLHKQDAAFDAVIMFLGSLQGFISNLIRDSKFNAAAYIAGKPSWKSKIQSQASLSGSLIREESMPEITYNDAHQMLNKRLVAFSKNREKKNIVGLGFVKEVYEELKTSGAVTFRAFLKKAVDEFQRGNFDKVVVTNPNAIPDKVLRDIKNSLNQHSNLQSKFESLLSLLQNSNEVNRQSCFAFLGTINLEKRIYESGTIWERNKWHLKNLRNTGLIINNEDVKGVYWCLTKDICRWNDDIMHKHKVSLEEYLVRVFFTSPIKKSRRAVAHPELEALDKIQQSCNVNQRKIINNAIDSYKKFLDKDEQQIIDVAPNDLVDNCIDVMSSLTRAFCSLNDIPPIEGTDSDVLSFWNRFWHSHDDIVEFINKTESYVDLDQDVATNIFGSCKDASAVAINFMVDQLEKSKILSLPYNQLTNTDCRVIDECRTCWQKNDYYNVVAKMSTHLEKKIRQNVFNIFRLFYGDEAKYRYRRYPKKLVSVIKNRTATDQKSGMKQFDNELGFCDRAEYKILMTKNTDEEYSKEGEMNWNDVFGTIFNPWDQDQMFKFLKEFATFNVAVAHNKTESIGSENQSQILQYLLDAVFVIGKINKSYDLIMEKKAQKKESKYYFGFKPKLDTDVIESIDVEPNKALQLIAKIRNKEQIDVDLENADSLEREYSMNYRKFVLLLNLLLHAGPQAQSNTGGKLNIESNQSPKFVFKFVNSDDQSHYC